MALRGYGPMSRTPGKHEKTRKRRETPTSGGMSEVSELSFIESLPWHSAVRCGVSEQLLATLAVRRRPCQPRIGYRLCTDAEMMK